MRSRHPGNKPTLVLWALVVAANLALLVANTGALGLFVALAVVVVLAGTAVAAWRLPRRAVAAWHPPRRAAVPTQRVAVPAMMPARARRSA